MTQNRCKDCGNFIQHYMLNECGKLGWVNCGHCVKGRGKTKRPDRKSCEEFVPGEDVRKKYVTKEYLRKALLQRVLDMELLPEENHQADT